MRIGIIISTPAQYHFYKNIVEKLINKGNDVRILYRDYGETLEVSEVKGEVFSRVRTNWDRIIKLPLDVLRARRLLKSFKPEIITGFEIYAPYTAKVLGSRSFIFYDSEPRSSKLLALQIKAYMPFVDTILTPSCYLDDLGKKHLRVDSLKELAYLHPRYFKPDERVLDDLGVGEDEYAILRFNAFDAAHDIGAGGFSNEEKVKLIKRLSKYLTVFISAEGKVPKSVEKYLLPVSKKKIHDVLYYAKMAVCETGTMTTEAAILGTPVVFLHPKVYLFGVFTELEEKYNLIFRYRPEHSEEAIQKSVELAENSNKEEWRKKKDKLLEDKINITEFMCWFIENYPESLEKFREKPEIQYHFT